MEGLMKKGNLGDETDPKELGNNMNVRGPVQTTLWRGVVEPPIVNVGTHLCSIDAAVNE